MNEKQLLFEISHIANQSAGFAEAVERIGALMEQELGGKGLTVSQLGDSSLDLGGIAATAEQFFEETAGLPCRSLYTVALRANGRELGRLVAFFACADSSDRQRQRITGFAGEQLGMLLERLRLAKQRRQLRAEISRIRVSISTRKALQRAEGILARRGFDSAMARDWLRREAARRGLSVAATANRVFEEEASRVEEPLAIPVRLSA